MFSSANNPRPLTAPPQETPLAATPTPIPGSPAAREAQQRATNQASALSRRVLATTPGSARQQAGAPRTAESGGARGAAHGRRDAGTGDRLLSAMTRNVQMAATQMDEAGNVQTSWVSMSVDDGGAVMDAGDAGDVDDASAADDAADDSPLDSASSDGASIDPARRALVRRSLTADLRGGSNSNADAAPEPPPSATHDDQTDAEAARQARANANGSGSSAALLNPWDSASYGLDADGASSSSGVGTGGGNAAGGEQAAGVSATSSAVGGIGATAPIKRAAAVQPPRAAPGAPRSVAARWMTGGVVMCAVVLIAALLINWLMPAPANNSEPETQQRGRTRR